MTLQGKTLLITGASRGIGLAIALRAARDGANIAILAKTAEPHQKLPGTIYTAASEIEAGNVARWLQEQNIPETRVYSTYPWINLEYNVLITPAKKYITGATVKTLTPGDVLIWDKRYSEVNGISLRKLQEPDNGLTQLAAFDEGGIVIFRVDRDLSAFEAQ